MNQATKSKYRPVLTAPQIEHIIALAKQDYANIESLTRDYSWSVISILSPFKTKIELEAISPAYSTTQPTTKEKQATLLESLGENTVLPEPEVQELSKEEYWEYCYNKYKRLGTSRLTFKEIDAAHEYRYLHNLMTEAEVKAFEAGLI